MDWTAAEQAAHGADQPILAALFFILDYSLRRTARPTGRTPDGSEIKKARPVGVYFAAPSVASPAHPDAELFVLQAEIDAADHRFQKAHDAQIDAEEAFYAIRPLRPSRPKLWTFLGVTEDEWRKKLAERKATDHFPVKAEPTPHLAAFFERREAHDTAVQAWEEETDRLEAEFGVSAKKDRTDKADAEVVAIRDKIVAKRARTIAGLKFKAKYIAEHVEDDCDAQVAASIAHDILAMPGLKEEQT